MYLFVGFQSLGAFTLLLTITPLSIYPYMNIRSQVGVYLYLTCIDRCNKGYKRLGI